MDGKQLIIALLIVMLPALLSFLWFMFWVAKLLRGGKKKKS